MKPGEMICKKCGRSIKDRENVFIPKNGFYPNLIVKYCYCEDCAKKRHWKVNYLVVYKEPK